MCCKMDAVNGKQPVQPNATYAAWTAAPASSLFAFDDLCPRKRLGSSYSYQHCRFLAHGFHVNLA